MIPWWGIVLIINAIVGLISFEWAWMRAYRFRNPNKMLDEVFFMFCRKDAQKWARWKFYPGALTLLIPRFIVGFTCLLVLIFTSFLLNFGYNSEVPIQNGCRKFLIKLSYRLTAIVVCMVFHC
jgi:hypothetical protein